jgi:hypothetical protein
MRDAMLAAPGGQHPEVDMTGGISAGSGGTKVPASARRSRGARGRNRNSQPVPD